MSSSGHIFEMIRRIRANKLEKKRFGRFQSQKKWDNKGTVKDCHPVNKKNDDELYLKELKKKMKMQYKEELIRIILVVIVLALILFWVTLKMFS